MNYNQGMMQEAVHMCCVYFFAFSFGAPPVILRPRQPPLWTLSQAGTCEQESQLHIVKKHPMMHLVFVVIVKKVLICFLSYVFKLSVVLFHRFNNYNV